MSDLAVFQTEDGGEITITNGQATVDDGLSTAVYLSLFGGNDDDSGIDPDNPKQWWGNRIEREPTRHMRSELQHLLHGLALIPSNLRRIEDAAQADLAWMTSTGLASFVLATASMPALNTVKLTIRAEIQGREFETAFTYRRSQQ